MRHATHLTLYHAKGLPFQHLEQPEIDHHTKFAQLHVSRW